MRDIKRIKPFLDRLEIVWNKVPDWRFGQLMVNVLNSLPYDPFYYDDNKLIQEFEKFFEK